MWRLSLSSICVLTYHVSLGHLHTVKTNTSTVHSLTHLHEYFLLAVLFKDGFTTINEMPFGYELKQAEQKQRSLEGLQGLCWCVTNSSHSASPRPRSASALWGARPAPRHQAASVPARPDVEHLPSIPIIHRQRLFVTQRIWGWFVCAAPHQLRSCRQRTSAREKAQGSRAKPQPQF